MRNHPAVVTEIQELAPNVLQITASLGLHGGLEPVTYRDFGSFWASGDAANRGLNPYGAYPATRTASL